MTIESGNEGKGDQQNPFLEQLKLEYGPDVKIVSVGACEDENFVDVFITANGEDLTIRKTRGWSQNENFKGTSSENSS